MNKDKEGEVLRSTGKMGGKYGQPPVLKQFLPLLAAMALAGCEALEASPYPVIKSELVVQDRASETIQYFGWIDNQRIVAMVIDQIKPHPNGGTRLSRSLKRWDVSSNAITTLVDDDQIAAVCVGGGNIRYYIKKLTPEGKEGLEGHFGMDGNIRQTTEKGAFFPSTCELQSKYPLPEWTKNIPNPEINIRRLRPEHGFLVVKRSAVEQEVNEIAMYAPQAPGSLDVSKLLGGRPIKRPTISPLYFEFKKAYLVESVSKDIPAWWLYPDGQIEKAWRLSRGDMNVSKTLSGGLLIPTAVFPIFGGNTFEPGPIGDNGLYSFAGLNNPKRIVKGRIAQELEVSPDGCKVAFANDDRPTIDPRKPMLFHKLQVINLCPEKMQ